MTEATSEQRISSFKTMMGFELMENQARRPWLFVRRDDGSVASYNLSVVAREFWSEHLHSDEAQGVEKYFLDYGVTLS